MRPSEWKPGDPLYSGGRERPIADVRADHWCGEDCMGHGPAAARWPEPMAAHDLEAVV